MTSVTVHRQKTLLVSEKFGPTIQGEGPFTGRRADFLRLAGCNLDCWWCDTPYSWDWTRFDRSTETTKVPVADLRKWALRDDAPGLLVLTGGEPMIQQRTWSRLIRDVLDQRDVQIETNGTIHPSSTLDDRIVYVVSPKLDHAELSRPERAIDLSILDEYLPLNSHMKFVIDWTTDELVGEQIMGIQQMATVLGWPMNRIWLMPEARTPDEVEVGLRSIAELTLLAGFNLTTRLHISLWGDKRGV